jgi:hypothetical protein
MKVDEPRSETALRRYLPLGALTGMLIVPEKFPPISVFVVIVLMTGSLA